LNRQDQGIRVESIRGYQAFHLFSQGKMLYGTVIAGGFDDTDRIMHAEGQNRASMQIRVISY